MTNKEVVELMRHSLFQLAEEAEDCGNVFAKVRSIADILVNALEKDLRGAFDRKVQSSNY